MKCSRECVDSQNVQLAIKGHVCLRNESVFLRSLIAFADEALGSGMRTSLLEAYFDAKRLWDEPKHSPQDFAFKVLDELAKVCFGALHVTAKRKDDTSPPDNSNTYRLLAPLEVEAVCEALKCVKIPGKRILETSIPVAFSEKVQKRAETWAASIGEIGEDGTDVQEGYLENISIREGFLSIDRIAHFDWRWQAESSEEIYEVLILFSRAGHSFRDFGFSSREQCLAISQAFLNGVANFLLLNPGSSGDNDEAHGYDLFNQTSHALAPSEIHDETEASPYIPPEGITEGDSSTVHWWARLPGNASLLMLEPLPGQYRAEYLTALQRLYGKTGFSGHDSTFSLLFLCKLSDGWVWFLDAIQERTLRQLTEIDSLAFDDVWKNFRFKHSGVISQMEHKGLLADLLHNPKDELICRDVGYMVDERDEQRIAVFRQIEGAIPGVGNSAFFYFRLTGHASKDESREGRLQPGALVAVFKVPRDKRKSGDLRPWEYQAVFRRLAETWRIKLVTLAQLHERVEQVVTDSLVRKELEDRAEAISGFSHQVGHVIGGKSNFPLYLFRIDDVLSEKESLARSAQIRYAALLPRAFEDALDKPEMLLKRWGKDTHGSETFIPLSDLLAEVWDNLALPILDYIKDLGETSNNFGCKRRLIVLAGREDAPKDFQVPNLEVLKAAIFEALWNAFEHGTFAETAVVNIAFPVEETNTLRIMISNPSDGKRHTEREGGKGVGHIRAMIQNLAAAGQLASEEDERRLVGWSDFECHYDSKESRWITNITLGGK